jgi:hypothetical protein
MTGYIIELGYQSGYSEFSGVDEWKSLVEIIQSIKPNELKTEYLEYETITQCERGCCKLDDFINRYYEKNNEYETVDATLKINNEEQYIIQCASGSGLIRTMKEGLRRAFCRIVLRKAHKIRLEISISVS